MKINPLGIRAYQHLDRQDRPAPAENQDRAVSKPDQPVTVEPQNPLTKSNLAVKAPSGNYAQFLSPAEREALDLLFARFSNDARFGAGYRAGSDNGEAEQTVGRLVDVKV